MFTGSVIIRTPFTFADLLEYLIFAAMAVAGILLIRKGPGKAVKVLGWTVAGTGIAALLWLVGWQIYIRVFLL